MSSAPARVNPAARQAPPGIPKIPFAFRADPIALDGLKLPRTARDLFVLLLDNARNRGWRTKLSNGTLARILGCCEMTVGRALVALERAGLIARDFTHGGRVRTGIRIVWDALQQPCGTERPCVQQERRTGPTAESEGFNIPVGLTRALLQSEDQTAPILPLGVDPDEVPDPATAASYLRSLIQAGRKGGGCTVPPTSGPPRGGYTTPPPVREMDRSPALVFGNCEKPAAKALNPDETPEGADSPRADTARTLFEGITAVDAVGGGIASGKPPKVALIEDTPAKRARGHDALSPPSGPRLDDPRREVARMVDSIAFGLATGRTGPSRMSPSRLARQLAEVRRRYSAGKSPPRA